MKNTTNYRIHKDLSNENRIRLDLLNGAKISDVKELRAYRITIEESFQDGNVQKHYITLEEYSKVETIINSKCIELENKLDDSDIDYTIDSFGEDGTQITIDGDNHKIYIMVCDDSFELSTKHNYIEAKMYEEEFKNRRGVKNVNTAMTYINRYI